jgi:hypothetical protein
MLTIVNFALLLVQKHLFYALQLLESFLGLRREGLCHNMHPFMGDKQSMSWRTHLRIIRMLVWMACEGEAVVCLLDI